MLPGIGKYSVIGGFYFYFQLITFLAWSAPDPISAWHEGVRRAEDGPALKRA